MRRVALLLVGVIGLIAIGYLVFSLSTNGKTGNFSETIEQNIVKLKDTNRTVQFADLTPFVWDRAYILEDPFLNGEAIDKIVGVKCNLDRLETDMKRRIIFVNEGKFVFDYIFDISRFWFTSEDSGTIELTRSSSVFVENETAKRIVLKIAQ